MVAGIWKSKDIRPELLRGKVWDTERGRNFQAICGTSAVDGFCRSNGDRLVAGGLVQGWKGKAVESLSEGSGEFMRSAVMTLD